MRKDLTPIFILAATLFLLTGSTNAAPQDFLRFSAKVTVNDGGGYLGNAVAVAGDTVVVANRVPNGLGGVYVFVRNGSVWTRQAKLESNDLSVNDDFGYSVAISGNYIVVGAPSARPNNDPSRGAAYVFFRTGNTWSQQAKLIASDGAINDGFGISVAITRDAYIMVGAPNHSVGTHAQQGAAYIYSRGGTTWSEQELVRSNGEAGDRFGWSIAMFGFDAVISSPFRDVNGTADQGQAYVYELIGTLWNGIATVTAPDGAAGNMFGDVLTMSGITLGSVTIASASINASKLYVFQKSGMAFPYQSTILAPPGLGISRAISLSGDRLLLGQPSGNSSMTATGLVNVYTRTGTAWAHSSDIVAPDAANFDNFGMAVAASPNNTVISAPWADVGSNPDLGAAYIYQTATKIRRADFDGDGKTDLSTYRASDGNWYVFQSGSGSALVRNWGIAGDVPTPGDFDGDGKADTAAYRASTGQWLVFRSSDSTVNIVSFGIAGDRPVAGDYDGDGKTDIAQFRPSEGVWYVFRSSDNQVSITTWGEANDLTVPADYDGDGKTDVAVFRPSTGVWYIYRSTAGPQVVGWGVAGDKPVEADYDGDGKDDVAIYRPSQGNWYVFQSSTNTPLIVNWGNATDVPAPGDYDGDGRDDFAVFRDGTWYAFQSTGGPLVSTWGVSGDVPIPARYIP